MRIWPAFLLGLFVLAAAACTTNPTGRTAFTGLMSPAEEARVGREAHPQVVAEFGGEYHDPALRDYISGLGQRLAAVSERPDLQWTFTVLNSDLVNAMALPGGYVYITTGILALANNEAEIASVIGHEVGHVTARHTAERYSQSVLATIALGAIGIAGGGDLASAADVGAAAYLSGFSRDQELEADTLGVRYMARAAYDPPASSSMLNNLALQSRLEDLLLGESRSDRYSVFATHPRTAERVAAAAEEARSQVVGEARLGEADFLKRIDGLYYGGDPENGFVRGREFVHPKLGFRFAVPPRFRLFNGAEQVVAVGPKGARIAFDRERVPAGRSMAGHFADLWARGIRFHDVETIRVNGLEAATGMARVSSRGGPVDLRLVAIRFDAETVCRFLFLSPTELAPPLAAEFRRTTHSFRLLTPEESASEQPLKIRLRLVQPGDTVESIARAMPFEEFRTERFRALNGMRAGERLAVGRMVKVIAER